MKRILLSLSASSLIFSGAMAQSNAGQEHTLPAKHTMDESDPSVGPHAMKKSAANAVVIWSEDFANGIPSDWVNQGYTVDPATGIPSPDPLAIWEYRGPSTSPNNTVGSRGAYASGAPISSPTRANGFIIFDSDWLDNGGQTLPDGSPNKGTGTANTPHIGTLTTDTIDCSGYQNIQITMQTYMRHFQARYFVAVSNDGGQTWADTVRFGTSVGVNSATPNPVTWAANISNVAGGQSDVVLQFIYDGAFNGDGYYFWMIDDVKITDLPPNELHFVSWRGAPAHDIIYPTGHPKYGNPQVDQATTLPITFDSNIYNFGYEDQNNVQLVVDIVDGNGVNVTTLTSPVLPVLPSGDTGSYNDFTVTGTWTPSATGTYHCIFTAVTDSIPANGTVAKDTFTINVNEWMHAGHFSTVDNTIGTANDMVSLAQGFSIPADVDTAGYALLEGISTYISSTSDTTGSIVVEVYDSTGFSYGTGGGPAGSPLAVKTLALNPNNIGQTTFIDFTTNGTPLALPSNAGYHVVISLLPNAQGENIRIGNDQTVMQPTSPTPLIAMQASDGTWYSRFTNSRTLSNLIINMHFTDRSFDINEVLKKQNAVKLYPNPSTTGEVTVEMGIGGTYELEVMSLTGKRVHSEVITVNGGEKLSRDFSNFGKGVYLLNFKGDDFGTTKKLIIE